jgi:D-alanine-D-alanine ligase
LTKSSTRKELATAIQNALRFSSRIVVEKAIIGREIEVGILGEGLAAKASVPGEIISAGEFYDFEAKYENPDSKTIVPAKLPKETIAQVQDYALQIFRAIGGSGLSRVDFFVDEKNRVIFNEINTFPGYTAISMYAKMWEKSGVPHKQLIEILLDIATEKSYV